MKRTSIRISHAVYSAFVRPVNTKIYQISYKDGDSLNTRLDNLILERRKKKTVPILNDDIIIPNQSNTRVYQKLREVEMTDLQKYLLFNQQYPFQNLSLENMEGEIWKKVDGYEDYLEVSNYGRVKRLPRFVMNVESGYWTEEKIGEQVLRVTHGALDSTFRLFIKIEITYIDDNGKKQFIRYSQIVSRLVYSVFVKPINPRDRKMVVGFKDNDPLNTRLDNLCLESISKAHKKFYTGITKSDKIFKGKSEEDKIINQYDLTGKYVNTYTSVFDAAKSVGIKQPSCISKVLNGKLRSAGGYLWKEGTAS